MVRRADGAAALVELLDGASAHLGERY